jgi:hypothetical protein
MRLSNNKLKGVDSSYSTYLRHTIDIRGDYKYFVQEVMIMPLVAAIPLVASIIAIIVYPALIFPILLVDATIISIHRGNQKPDIPNRLPIYVKNWWGITPKLKLMKSIADGIVFYGNLRNSKNQEIWNSKTQELKHKMDNTGTGGGKTTSILGSLVPAFGNSGQTTLTEAKGDALIARQYMNLAAEFCLEDDIHITTYATSNAPKEKGYKRSHSTNLHTGNDAAATNEIITGLLPSSNGQNSVFVQRATILGKIANQLVYERAANSDDGYRVTLKAMRKMLNLDELKKSLSAPWLKSEALRSEIVYYLRDLQVDVQNPKKEANDKSVEQHMYAQMYFTKGLSTLTDTFGFIFNMQYGDYIWSDILNRKRHIYQLVPAIDKSETEMEYISKIHAQLILNAVKSFLNPRVQGRAHEINQYKHIGHLSKLILDEFTFIIDSSVPTWVAQVRSMNIAVAVYFQSLELTESKNKDVMIAIQNISGTLCVGQTNDPKAREIVIKAAGKTQVARPKHVEKRGSSNKYVYSKTLDLNMVDIFEHDDIQQQTFGQSHTVLIGEKNKETGNNLAMRSQQFYLGQDVFDKLESQDNIVLNHFIEHTDRVRPRKNIIKLANLKRKPIEKKITPNLPPINNDTDNEDTDSINSTQVQSAIENINDNSKPMSVPHVNQNIINKTAKVTSKNKTDENQMDMFSCPNEIEEISKEIQKHPDQPYTTNQPPKNTNPKNIEVIQEKHEPKTLNELLAIVPNELMERISKPNGSLEDYVSLYEILDKQSYDADHFNYPVDSKNEDGLFEDETLPIIQIMNEACSKRLSKATETQDEYDDASVEDFLDF